MIGWWQPEAPVRIIAATGHGVSSGESHGLYATSYVVPAERTLVAVASWAVTNVSFTLDVDWATLRLNAAHVTHIRAPAIGGVNETAAPLQRAATWAWGGTITVAPEQGILLVLEPPSLKTDDEASSAAPDLLWLTSPTLPRQTVVAVYTSATPNRTRPITMRLCRGGSEPLPTAASAPCAGTQAEPSTQAGDGLSAMFAVPSSWPLAV
jgi:hypothetical protein